MTFYIDMDGTLVDFVSQVNKYDFWRKDKVNKVDWKKVKGMGTRFWSEMNWMPEAERYFHYLFNLSEEGLIELYILSSIDFEDGENGKLQWIKNHTDFPIENVIFVGEPEYKAEYASPDSWLIDDRKKSLIPFNEAGGNIIDFNGDWFQTYRKIEEEICNYILANKKKKSINKEPEHVLYEFLSEAAFKCMTDENCFKQGYLIDEDGNYFSKKEVFEISDLSEPEKSLLFYNKKLKTKYVYRLRFKSIELSKKINTILDKYSKKINELPNEVHNYGIMDGSIDYFRLGEKIVSGCNILNSDDRPYEKIERPAYVPEQISDEEYEANENALIVLNEINLEIKHILKQKSLLKNQK